MNGSNGIMSNEPKTQIEYCPVCQDVVYCPEYTVWCNRDGVCESCIEKRERITTLNEDNIRYGQYATSTHVSADIVNGSLHPTRRLPEPRI